MGLESGEQMLLPPNTYSVSRPIPSELHQYAYEALLLRICLIFFSSSMMSLSSYTAQEVDTQLIPVAMHARMKQ